STLFLSLLINKEKTTESVFDVFLPGVLRVCASDGGESNERFDRPRRFLRYYNLILQFCLPPLNEPTRFSCEKRAKRKKSAFSRAARPCVISPKNYNEDGSVRTVDVKPSRPSVFRLCERR
ncbi:MAG: hypothetical protein IJE77_11720, partial [Thermoguttaceae bacterium]|nr:hypothetical protein [Thermoguttaceae bacterium]